MSTKVVGVKLHSSGWCGSKSRSSGCATVSNAPITPSPAARARARPAAKKASAGSRPGRARRGGRCAARSRAPCGSPLIPLRPVVERRPPVVRGEPRLEELVGPDREPLLDRWIVGVAEVAGEEVVLETDRAHAVEDVLERRLAAERRAQAALDDAAARDERDLVLDGEVLAGELGMRDNDMRDAFLERGVDDGERVVAAEVRGGEDEAVARDRAQHVTRLGPHGAARARHCNGLDGEA